ncbi:head-tail connector protein [Roseomonas elaeocarpi]|uniref:Phage gp6-like head-tail connector protein n=1 Tax=Roseomonas elaeocarpi TaxID=907779 RepID=A0ABV6JTK8_9PROT
MQLSLRVVRPPAIEPVSPVDAAMHCRLAASEPMLEPYVAAARGWAEAWLGRALITQTLCATVGRSLPPGLVAGVVPYAGGYFSTGYPFLGARGLWNSPLELPRSPVQAITEVAITRQDGERSVLAADGYSARLASEPGTLQVQPNAARPGDLVSVTFVAGYGETKEDVPMPIRQGIMLLTAFLYENRGDAGGDPPKAAEMLMWPFRLVTFGG